MTLTSTAAYVYHPYRDNSSIILNNNANANNNSRHYSHFCGGGSSTLPPQIGNGSNSLKLAQQHFSGNIAQITGHEQRQSHLQASAPQQQQQLTALQQPEQRRQLSSELAGAEAAGCCLLKTLISNVLTFATRSRRKADLGSREPQQQVSAVHTATTTSGGILTSTKKAGITNCSKVSSAKVLRRRPTATQQASGDLSIADSMDDADVEKICQIPDGLDRNEWLATHTLALFEHVNALCGTVSEVCTPVTCPTMNYPGASKANWVDERGKRHNYSAMRYIDSVMSLCEASRKSQQLFPTKFGATFGPEFEAHCRRMIRLLWHCSGHLYHKHWDHMCALNLRAQFSLVLAHLATIAKMFSLLDIKEASAIQAALLVVRPPLVPEYESTTPPSSAAAATVAGERPQRPAKRLNSGDDDANDVGGGTMANEGRNADGSGDTVAVGGTVGATTPSKIAAPAWVGSTSGAPLEHIFAGYVGRPSSSSLASSGNNGVENSAACGGVPLHLAELFYLDSYGCHANPIGPPPAGSRGFQIPAMKSGSWSGHPAVLEPATTSVGDSVRATTTSPSTTTMTTDVAPSTATAGDQNATNRSFKNFVPTC